MSIDRRAAPTTLGPYTVHERLGAGGMATVHRATIDIGVGVQREVALKRLREEHSGDRRLIDDLIREAKLLAGLDHPNIVEVHDLGRIDDRYFIAMELVRGRSLGKLLVAGRPPIDVALAILLELCDALDHASHLVHGDLSPSNVLVNEAGHVKLIDFGLSRRSGQQRSAAARGTPGYMSMEARLCPDESDARTDVFSTGVIAWELITGARLFGDGTRIRASAICPPSCLVSCSGLSTTSSCVPSPGRPRNAGSPRASFAMHSIGCAVAPRRSASPRGFALAGPHTAPSSCERSYCARRCPRRALPFRSRSGDARLKRTG